MTRTEAKQILNLEQHFTRDQLKSAYRKLALLHHPDKGGDTKEFIKIKDAYELLAGKVTTRRRAPIRQTGTYVVVSNWVYIRTPAGWTNSATSW